MKINKHSETQFASSSKNNRAFIRQRRRLFCPILFLILLTTINRMRFGIQKVSLFGSSCISESSQQVHCDLQRDWHCLEMGHQFPSIKPMCGAVPLTAIHGEVIPLPLGANKQTHSLPQSPPGGLSHHSEWSITQWWIKRKTIHPSLIFSPPMSSPISSPPPLHSPSLWSTFLCSAPLSSILGVPA